MTPQQIIPFIGATVSIGGIIFQTGKHADRLDFLWSKVEAQEKKEEYQPFHASKMVGVRVKQFNI